MDDDLLTTKIERGFTHLDADGDGCLTETDHILMGEASARVLGHAPDSAAEHTIIDGYVTIWRDLHQAQAGGADKVTREEFIASTLSLADDKEAAAATVGRLAELYLSVADANGDGLVDRAEFFAFHQGHFPTLGRDRADTAFRHLDRDGDGMLSYAEFTGAIVEYWTSRDPEAPGNWWTGVHPLEEE